MCGCSALTHERRTADRLHAQAIELGGLSAQIAHVVAQAVPAGQLPQPEGNEWAQRLMTRKLPVRADVRRVGVESMSWKQRQELPEDCAMMAQGLDLL